MRLQRRNALSQVALTYYTLAKLREPTELGWSRLSGFLYDCEGSHRETEILAHTQALLPDDVRIQFEVNAEATLAEFLPQGRYFECSDLRVGAPSQRAPKLGVELGR